MKTVLITGGARGIGRCIVANLLNEGWAVCFGDVDEEAGTDCLEEYGQPDRLVFHHSDVSQEDAVRSLVDCCIDTFGRLDAIVNNAGIGIGKPVESLSMHEWRKVIDTNLTSCFLTAKYAASELRKNRGAMVNIASTRAIQSEANTEAYSASKGGIVALTHALAVSLSGRVRINCISPGWIDTALWQTRAERKAPELRKIDHTQHPAGRVGKPGDIAEMVAWLLSDKAEFITGQNFVVDGGMTTKMIYEPD